MVAEWITQGLSRAGMMEVVDARSMVELVHETSESDSAGNRVDPTRTLATKTGAGTVVTGTVYRDGDTLLVQVRVLDPVTGALRATVPPVRVSADHPTGALEPLRERVTGVLAVLFDARLGNMGAISSEPPTYEAYAEHLQGVRWFSRDFSRALPHFQRASLLDSSFQQARLWTGIALANQRRYTESDSVFRMLRRAADRLAPYDAANLEYFHSGFVQGDWNRSHEAARRMRELAPTAAHAQYGAGLTAIYAQRISEGLADLARIDVTQGWGKDWASRILLARIRSHEAMGELEEAHRLAVMLRENDPSSGWQRVQELRLLALRGNHAELEARLSEAMSLPASMVGWEPFDSGDMLFQVGIAARYGGDSAFSDSLFQRAGAWYASQEHDSTTNAFRRRGQARVQFALKQFDAARVQFEALAGSRLTTPEDVGMLALIALRQSRREEAMRLLASLESDTASYRFGQARGWAARIVAATGDADRAVQLLHRARREGFTRVREIMWDPSFAPLRTHAGYRAFMAPIPITVQTPGRTSPPRS
jgi:tetratricopeptide (TPR) repeat protein